MKVSIILLLLAVQLLARDIIIANNTGYSIARIDVAHIDVPLIVVNVLSNKLASHQQVIVHLADDYKMCNLRLVFSQGNHIDWSMLDLTGIHELVFSVEKSRVKVHYE